LAVPADAGRSDALHLRLIGAQFYERPVKLRLPFRFGVVTLTEAPQIFVRARIRLTDGREGDGVSAELMVPKWFDKSPELSHKQNFDQLRRALAIARSALVDAGQGTSFGLSAAVESAVHVACAQEKLGGLIASFGLALLDRAILDALGRIEGRDIFAAVRANLIGLNATTAGDLAGFEIGRFLGSVEPAQSIHVRHTVGLIDALTEGELGANRLNDGLPETLEGAIAAYGHTHFKLKVAGDLEADIDRLSRIAAVLDRSADPYFATLDGNEQFEDIDAVTAMWRRIEAEPRLRRLKSAILFIEQPIARSRVLAAPVTSLAKDVSIEIDESDSHMGAFWQARERGYAGVSSKACKGFYRALLNRARVAKWNAEEGAERFFMSAEDLTTQSGIAVQQDFAQALLVGATHVERNGHHYVDGMVGAPPAEQEAFRAANPALYSRAEGHVRLAIRDGRAALASLQAMPGLAVGPMPDFDAMTETTPSE
jgi:hypothetical protein